MNDLEDRLRSALSAYRDQVVASGDLLAPPERERPRPRPRLQLLAAAVLVVVLAATAIGVAVSSRSDEADLDVAVGGGTASAAEFDAAADVLCIAVERGVDEATLRFDTQEAFQVVAASRAEVVDRIWSALVALPRPADADRQVAAGRAAATLRAADRLAANALDQAERGDLAAADASLSGVDVRLFLVARLLGVDGDGRCAEIGRR